MNTYEIEVDVAQNTVTFRVNGEEDWVLDGEFVKALRYTTKGPALLVTINRDADLFAANVERNVRVYPLPDNVTGFVAHHILWAALAACHVDNCGPGVEVDGQLRCAWAA